MNLDQLQPGDLVALASGGPLLRLVGTNGVQFAWGGSMRAPRSLWLCQWWEAPTGRRREAWFPADTLRLLKRP